MRNVFQFDVSCAACRLAARSWQHSALVLEFSNEYLVAKIGFDTAENEPCKVCREVENVGGCESSAPARAGTPCPSRTCRSGSGRWSSRGPARRSTCCAARFSRAIQEGRFCYTYRRKILLHRERHWMQKTLRFREDVQSENEFYRVRNLEGWDRMSWKNLNWELDFRKRSTSPAKIERKSSSEKI